MMHTQQTEQELTREERFQPRKKQARLLTPPKGSHPRIALLMVCAIIALSLFSALLPYLGIYPKVPPTAIGIISTVLNVLCFLAIHLAYIVPLRENRRKTLSILFCISLLLSIAMSLYTAITSIASLGSGNGQTAGTIIIGFVSGLISLALDPMLILLLGLRLGKSTEKIVALIYAITLVLTFVSMFSYFAMAPLGYDAYVGEGYTTRMIFNTALAGAGNLFSTVFYCIWPVLDRPVLSKKAKGMQSDEQPSNPDAGE